MSRNDGEDFAQRLYARIPGQYRVLDQEQGFPLLALMRVIGEQAANLRQDLDALWDNFFIETCEEWVVPYIGALVGTNLLAHPVGQSNRLDVWNTVIWRRSKGTPRMLGALATEISGWPADFTEFFQALGWAQNLNHLRLDHPLTPDVRRPGALDLLGHSNDPFAHAADFKPARPLDQPRGGRAAWGTPGRHQIRNLGFFARRLATFSVNGATPAAVLPGGTAPAGAAVFTFDPLFREVPLFVRESGLPLTRAAFNDAPEKYFGSDVAVRQAGILVASPGAAGAGSAAAGAAGAGSAVRQSEILPPREGGAEAGFAVGRPGTVPAREGVARPGSAVRQAGILPAGEGAGGAGSAARESGIRVASARAGLAVRRSGILAASAGFAGVGGSRNPATFGGGGAGLSLDATRGMRLAEPDGHAPGGAHFTIAAEWHGAGTPVVLGALSTLKGTFVAGTSATEEGQLVVSVRNGFPGLGPSPAGRFPGAVIAVRAARTGPVRRADALYVFLPPAFVTPGSPAAVVVADDGSTYTRVDLTPQSLARAAEIPANTPSAAPATGLLRLNRKTPGIRLLDASRFGTGGASILVRADICTGDFQSLGAVAGADLTGVTLPDIQVPSPWPANQYVSSNASLTDNLPSQGLLSLHVAPVNGTFLPESELILTNRDGRGLLVYLPEFAVIGSEGADLFVADDGSTYFAPADQAVRLAVIRDNSLATLALARAAAGQVLPIPGLLPLQQRRAVALNLCRPERRALVAPGQLGIDPELGRFAFAPNDPALGGGDPDLSVDYVEAFSDRVGALNFDRGLTGEPAATRLVSRTGDASAELPVHTDIASAFAAAGDGDVIEIIDSATYAATAPAVLSNAAVRGVTLRAAAGQRPCLAFYSAAGVPAPASLQITVAMDRLDLNGLLLSGGPMSVEAAIGTVHLVACTLDPGSASGTGSLIVTDSDTNSNSDYILCRSITGAVRLQPGVGRITFADSIVDARGGVGIDGETVVQLERTTVLGRIHCEVLNASESLLDDLAVADDRQTGCVRFTRFELHSILPRRFQCVPNEDQARASKTVRCLVPLFNSLRYGRPDYMQLSAGCPPEILTAGPEGAEPGAFAGSLNQIRLGNMLTKLREFMPAGLTAVVIGET